MNAREIYANLWPHISVCTFIMWLICDLLIFQIQDSSNLGFNLLCLQWGALIRFQAPNWFHFHISISKDGSRSSVENAKSVRPVVATWYKLTVLTLWNEMPASLKFKSNSKRRNIEKSQIDFIHTKTTSTEKKFRNKKKLEKNKTKYHSKWVPNRRASCLSR